MLNDGFFFSILWSLPTLVTCIIGIAVVRARALPDKAKSFAVTGLSLMILGSFGGLVFSLFLRMGGLDYSSGSFHFMQMGYSALMQLLHVASVVFLIMAICNRGQAVDQKVETQNPYGQ